MLMRKDKSYGHKGHDEPQRTQRVKTGMVATIKLKDIN